MDILHFRYPVEGMLDPVGNDHEVSLSMRSFEKEIDPSRGHEGMNYGY